MLFLYTEYVWLVAEMSGSEDQVSDNGDIHQSTGDHYMMDIQHIFGKIAMSLVWHPEDLYDMYT